MGDRVGVDLRRQRRLPVARQLIRSAYVGEPLRDAGQRFDGGRLRVPEHHVHHAGQADLRGDPLEHQHLFVSGGDHMTLALATDHEPHHLSAEVPAPPPAVECAVGPAQYVRHGRHLGVRIAERGEDALGGEVTGDLLGDDAALVLVGNVGPDPERQREVHQVQQVRDDEHAVDGHFDTHHVVVVGGFGIAEEGAGHHFSRRAEMWSVAS